MTAPICGFDIGTENCYIGVARQGGIEIILNDFSQRSTPGYVCLLPQQRELGVTAKQKQNMNINNTYYNLRGLIGRSYVDVVNNDDLPFPIEQGENDEAAIIANIDGVQHHITATQLLAMVLTKLKQLSNNTSECVINCPNYFNDRQRRALKNAAYIANMNVSRILPDLSAVALYYCFYRINAKEENNQLIAFIDIGASCTQCSVVDYNPKKHTIQVLAMEYERNLGGLVFDNIIANYFIKQENMSISKRTKVRLLAECEKLKKQMSANSNDIPINIECLTCDKDFSSKMNRALFEDLCQDEFKKIENLLNRLLSSAQTKINTDKNQNAELKFSAIEIVGGSSRIPAIKRIVKDVFGVEPTSTLNADEAVALGCTLQSALLSPNYKVLRDFEIIDYQAYQIDCSYYYENENNPEFHKVSPLFQRGSAVPFTRQIILNCYSLPIIFMLNYDSNAICQYRIYLNEDNKTSLEFPCKMKVRVRLDNDGLISITSACLNLEESKEKKSEKNESEDNSKNEVKIIKLDIVKDFYVGQFKDDQLEYCKTLESNLVLADKNYNEKIDTLNELEEYIYEWKDKIESSELSKFLSNDDKCNFVSDLKNTQKLLLKDEETRVIQDKSIYVEILNNLKKKYTNVIMQRSQELKTLEDSLRKLEQLSLQADKLMNDLDTGELNNVMIQSNLYEINIFVRKAFSYILNYEYAEFTPKHYEESYVNGLIKRLELDIKKINNSIEQKKKDEEDKLKKKEEELMQTTIPENNSIKHENNHEPVQNESNSMDIDK